MIENNKRIYLDYAATTPLDEGVFEAMRPYFGEKFGNASSAHWFGQEARKALDLARAQTAEFLDCRPEEVIFTSGATESNNLAIKGIINKIGLQTIVYGLPPNTRPHIITSRIEHHCVLDTCKSLEGMGVVEVTYLSVNKDGIVEIAEVEKAIKENTVLVSVMYVNNEIGTIQPIAEIGALIKKINAGRQQRIYPHTLSGDEGKSGIIPIKGVGVYFHTDAVQAINYLNCKVDELGVDLLSMSAHKFYGPKGVGALYIRKGTPIKKIQDGGAHEYDLRAGTYNIAGIVGMGEAIAKVKNEKLKIKNVQDLRDRIIDRVLKSVPNVKLNGSRDNRLPNSINFSFPGAEGESIMMALDLEGIAISTGSACASENLQPSHVLIALGLAPEESHTSIRVSIGKYTSEAEVDRFLKTLPRVVERLRQISGKVHQPKGKLPEDFGC